MEKIAPPGDQGDLSDYNKIAMLLRGLAGFVLDSNGIRLGYARVYFS
jgi:hypothetical protein